MVLMPPGSAKSTYASVLFPAWFLAQHPRAAIIAASHTAELAERFGRRVRNMIGEHANFLGYGLSADSTAAGRWDTNQGGEFFAAGVGGAVTGRRADLAIIDDPVKSREEADSIRFRDRAWDWFRADLMTRLKPGAKIVLIQTRWHQDDLAGRLLRAEASRWSVLRLPALAGADDPMGREPGEPLWPTWEGEEALADKRKTIGERDWSALFQQQPTVEGGQIIRAEWWQSWTKPVGTPDFVLISVDPAYTKADENDPSACTVWHVTTADDGRQCLLLRYAWAKRLEFPELVTEIIETWEHFAPKGIPCRILVEAKASGLSVVQEMRRRIDTIPVWEAKVKGDKVARAYACQTTFEAGKVFALASVEGEFRPWAASVIEECAAFPSGEHDDQMDTVSQAVRHVREMGIELHPEDDPPPPPSAAGLPGAKRMYGAVGGRR